MTNNKEKSKALALISSGIDSPVAAYLMKKKNVEIVGIHFDNRPFTDARQITKTARICKVLGIKKLYVVKHGLSMGDVLSKIDRRFTCLICRRFMFRVAEKIAQKEGCGFLVTGENLGQVASQTLQNMIVCTKAIKIPILRPLLCNDKQETVEIAKKIGTYEISIEPPGCCRLVPEHPATRSTIDIIENEERDIDVEKVIAERVKDMEIIDI